MKKKIKMDNQKLLSMLLLQFFFFQLLKMSKNIIGNWYFPLLIKIKFLQNTVLGSIKFSVGDILYLLLGILLLYWIIKIIVGWAKKDKLSVKSYTIKILWTVNIFYSLFMLSIGLLYGYNNFPQYQAKEEKIFLNEYKIVANVLLNDCRELRKKVTVDKKNNFWVDENKMIYTLYWEQNAFYNLPKQKPNVKESLFSFVMKKLGVSGYYNPFTGEAQIIKGLPGTFLPFTIAHEMGHQAGVAPENEANFYAFYMGESSSNVNFQYSIKYKALKYILREIYPYDHDFVKRILNNYSEGMKRDSASEKKYYEENHGWGADVFSFMNNTYLKSNNQDGIIAYNQVAGMIVSFYKKNYSNLFIQKENSIPDIY